MYKQCYPVHPTNAELYKNELLYLNAQYKVDISALHTAWSTVGHLWWWQRAQQKDTVANSSYLKASTKSWGYLSPENKIRGVTWLSLLFF